MHTLSHTYTKWRIDKILFFSFFFFFFGGELNSMLPKATNILQGRKDMFYLATHSTHLQLYGVGHMVKDHSDSERGNLLPPHGLLFPISSKGSFICIIPQNRITHTTAFVTPAVEHWLEREIAQWVHPMKDRSNDPSHHERTLLPRSYISFQHPTKELCWSLL